MADVSQRENILISSFGNRQVLVALPENEMAGGAHGVFPESSGCTVELLKSLPNNLNNGFDRISVYQVTLNPNTNRADQRFTLQQATNPPNILIDGTVHMEADWAFPMESIQAVIPEGALNRQPFAVAVSDQSGSTGYHWVSATYGQIQVVDTVYPDMTKVGAPALRLYNISPTASDSNSNFQLQLVAPSRQNSGCVNVNIVTRPSNQ